MTVSLEPNPFLEPLYAPVGNPVARDVYASMGYALTQWESAEVLLATMFSILVRPTGGTHVAFRAIGGLFSSGGRRELIEHAAEAYFALFSVGIDDGDKEKGVKLHKKIKSFLKLFGDASRRRDDIAHGVVYSDPIHPSIKQIMYFLVPAHYASRKTEPLPPFKPSYKFSTVELDLYSTLFGLLHSRAAELNVEISGFYLALPETVRERHP